MILHLCDLYLEGGGQRAFCRTCRTYPRHIEEFEGLREISLSLSCPAAADLILNCTEPVRFLHAEDEKEEEPYEDFDFFLFTKLEDARSLILRILQDRAHPFRIRAAAALALSHDLQQRIDTVGRGCDHIPSIQPVINKQLTLLTASYGMRIHPFFKTLQAHQGVDYTIPEGSRVFATADGVVRNVSSRSSTQGRTVVIDHGNGYETSYSHLSKINVRKGQQVRRGDIIALSGDTGLSLAPHLHYEVRKDGMRVDPVHYFFMELSPGEYQRLMRIAQSGMQSFD